MDLGRKMRRIGCLASLLAVGTVAQAGQLTFKSENGDISGEFGGRVIAHGRFFTESNVREDAFYFKEVFLDSKGKLYKVFEYKVEGDFSSSTASLRDGWMAWKMHDMFRLQFGQFKVPFLFEEVTSASATDFPERPLIDRLAPGREIGMQVNGNLLEDGAVSYAAGMVNGTGLNAVDTNDSKDLFGQIRFCPFKMMEMEEEMGNLQLAVSGTHGNQKTDAVSGVLADVTDPSTGTTVIDYSPGGSATVFASGPRDRMGYEVLWAKGPASVTFEYARMDQTAQRNYPSGDPGTLKEDGFTINGWYLGGSYFLTGEDKKLGSLPEVKNPVGTGGYGAFEIVARYAFFNPDQKLLQNFPTHTYADTNFTASKVTETFVGVNYFPVNGVRFSLAWVTNDFENDLDEGLEGRTQGDESVILTRMQVMF